MTEPKRLGAVELSIYDPSEWPPEQAALRTAVGVTAHDPATGIKVSCHAHRTRDANRLEALAELERQVAELLAARAGGEVP